VKRKVPEAPPWTQATLLYMPRSIARMGSAAVVSVISASPLAGPAAACDDDIVFLPERR
jgi:hypothetical protein